MVIRILKTYVVKGNGSLYMLHLLCIFAVLDIRHHIHDFLETFDTGDSTLELLRKLYDSAYSGKKGGYIHGIGHQISRLHLALNHENASCHNHHHIHQSIKGPGGNLKSRHVAVGILLNIHEIPVALAELGNLHRLIGKGPDHTVAQQGVLNLGIELAYLVSLPAECLLHLHVKPGTGNNHNRHQHKYEQGQFQIDA